MSKDWTGNRRSIMATLGASNHSQSEREANDYYATDPAVLDLLSTKYHIPPVVCEPCCGEGHLSKKLIEMGRKVYSSDLIDRGYGQVRDFFGITELPGDCNCILTNPPFKYSTEIILHALDILKEGGQLVLFMRTAVLEGLTRYKKIYSVTPPKLVLQFTCRALCAKNGDFKAMGKGGSASAYAFFIWEKGWCGKTAIDWLV